MLRRSLIILMEIGAIFIVVLSAVLFWAAYYVDTDEFRQQLVHAVEQVTGQPVSLEGELNIALYPTISLEILGLVIDSDAGSGDAALLEFDELRVNVRLMPLLAKRIELRTIVVEGMTVNVVRSKDGEINWQSVIERQSALFAKSPINGGSIAGLSLAGLEIGDATIHVADRQAGNTFKLSGVELRTGTIVAGEDVPFTARSQFVWKNGNVESQFILKGVIESNEGGTYRLKNANIYASVGGGFLPAGANPGEMTANLIVDSEKKNIVVNDMQLRFLGLRAKGSLKSGNLSQQLTASGKLILQPFIPSTIIHRYFPDVPVDSVDGLKAGSFASDFSVDESGIHFNKLVATLDDLTVKGSGEVHGYRHPKIAFTLRGTNVDLDRYLPLFETGTPFIWDDFSLGFWGKLRSAGTVRADSFTVLGQTIKDIRLTVDADKRRVMVDAGANMEGLEDLSGRAEFRFGTNAQTKAPTFGGNLELRAKSPTGGFPALDMDTVKVTGDSRVLLKMEVALMDCPPKERSIAILRNLKSDIRFLLGSGQSTYADSGSEYVLSYSTAELTVNSVPIAMQGSELFGFNTSFSLHGKGKKRVHAFSLTGQGPLVTAVDKVYVKSSGLQLKSNITGKLYTQQPSRLHFSGKVGFDSDKANLVIKDATIRTLETAVKGSGIFSDLDKSFKGSGTLSIPKANVRRIIFLLSKFGVRTYDPEALKAASLSTRFSMDSDGFRLSELEGKLDGMSFNGHVIGQGLKNPKLVFSLSAGAFDLDRYLPPSVKPTLKESREGKEPKKAPPVDLPLTFLRMLRLNGKAWFEEFKLAKVRAKGLNAIIQADNGDIRISKGVGKVNEGDLTADWTAKVEQGALSTHLKLHVEDLRAGPLLKGMVDREYIKGKTDVDFDLISFGKTDDDIVQNLDGRAWARVRNGSFKFTGYDLPDLKKDTQGQRLSAMKGNRTVERRTAFSKAVAYFMVKEGVFRVDKLRVEAPPVLQAYGKGQFSLPANTIDLSIRNDFVVVPSVTLHLKGKLSDPEVKIPTGEIVDKTVRNILSLPEKSFNFLRDLFQ